MSSYFTRKWSCWFATSSCLIISLPSISADVLDDNFDAGDFSVINIVGSVALSSLNSVWVISWFAKLPAKVHSFSFRHLLTH